MYHLMILFLGEPCDATKISHDPTRVPCDPQEYHVILLAYHMILTEYHLWKPQESCATCVKIFSNHIRIVCEKLSPPTAKTLSVHLLIIFLIQKLNDSMQTHKQSFDKYWRLSSPFMYMPSIFVPHRDKSCIPSVLSTSISSRSHLALFFRRASQDRPTKFT